MNSPGPSPEGGAVQALAKSVIEGLRRGVCDPGIFETLGDPDAARSAAAFLAAAGDEELGAAPEHWAAGLLASARPGFGARCLLDLARARRESGARLEVARTPLLPRLLGSSNFLARLLLRQPEWLADLEGSMPAPPSACSGGEWAEIRTGKYRGLLRIAARDLAGRELPESLAELSELADGCLRAGLELAARETSAPAPAVLALGKLGGRELNFSSDIDLLFLSDPPDGDVVAHEQAVAKLIRHLKARLEVPGEHGFVYRVDLDLRPGGPSGDLAHSADETLAYYEACGAEWERQMLIRLRPVAGPSSTAEAFAQGIAPFVYRRLIDPGVMRAVREMKERIESERRGAGRDLEADLKEGPGGIRDVEFLVQSFQLFHGGRHTELRTGNVLEALACLERLGLLPSAAAHALSDAYTWLRRAEHALQLVEDQQTAAFPRDPAAQLGLARRLGYGEVEAARARDRLLDDWTRVRSQARSHFEALVLDPRT